MLPMLSKSMAFFPELYQALSVGVVPQTTIDVAGLSAGVCLGWQLVIRPNPDSAQLNRISGRSLQVAMVQEMMGKTGQS